MELTDSLNLTGQVIVEIHDAATGKLKSRDIIKNMVVTAGKQSIARLLSGDTTNGNGVITFAAVGTGTALPTAGDIKLQTELTRKQVSIRNIIGKIASFKTFFNQDEANGVLREIGLFGGLATTTSDSGTLFARLNISRTKSSNDTLSIEHQIALN